MVSLVLNYESNWRLISSPSQEGGGEGTARTKHTSQHNYPPSVTQTEDSYLVIRTDPRAPGLGSSWKLLCARTLAPVTPCTLGVLGMHTPDVLGVRQR